MVNLLRRYGIDASKYSKGDAGRLISQLKGKLTKGQAKVLIRANFAPDEVRNLAPDHASRLIDKVKENGWRRPDSGAADPLDVPVGAPRGRFSHDRARPDLRPAPPRRATGTLRRRVARPLGGADESEVRAVTSRRWPLKADVIDLLIERDERAAVMEVEGGLSREDAERAAMEELTAQAAEVSR
jgi:hypothetical protein